VTVATAGAPEGPSRVSASSGEAPVPRVGPTNRLAGLAGAFVLGVTPLLAAGQWPGVAAGSRLDAEDGIVTTRHEIPLDGRTLSYTARAGLIPIRDNATGEAHGSMFFISYALDDAPGGGPRPLTFLWNGGPGSSSSLVHLLGFGPKRIGADGEVLPNDGTWLDATDLVFVDPVGTGYSRPTAKEHAAEFYQNRGDAESVAELIRVYLTRADAWDAPLFLAGESFGVMRATRVADVLQRRGIPVAGMIHIGLVPRLAPIDAELETALAVPTYAATALHHGRLPADLARDFDSALRDARAWAADTYAPALARRGSLGEAERRELLAALSRWTGVDAARAADSTLEIGIGAFAEGLLADQGLVVGRYDSRLTGPLDPSQTMYDPTTDPSLRDIIDDVAVVRYMRDELEYRSDLAYQGPFGGGYPSPERPRGDWMSVQWDWSESTRARVDDQTSDARPAVERVLRADEDVRVFVACGYYDLVCSYAVIDEMLARMDPALAGRVTVRTYHGGHAVYTDGEARRAMRADVSGFIRETVAGAGR